MVGDLFQLLNQGRDHAFYRRFALVEITGSGLVALIDYLGDTLHQLRPGFSPHCRGDLLLLIANQRQLLIGSLPFRGEFGLQPCTGGRDNLQLLLQHTDLLHSSITLILHSIDSLLPLPCLFLGNSEAPATDDKTCNGPHHTEH
ncbi:hypothetical protein ACLMAJ_23375 [Nocardia sp. KC 131]|uniref:hypothetical protein n=1 Tax=Nocardia arseniciresistens TaxID=3392119 RepID=UPI00398F2E7E